MAGRHNDLQAKSVFYIIVLYVLEGVTEDLQKTIYPILDGGWGWWDTGQRAQLCRGER